MPRPSRHTPVQKAAMLAQARALLRGGMKRCDIADHLGIQLGSLSGWLREQTLDQLYPPLERSSNPRARSAPPARVQH